MSRWSVLTIVMLGVLGLSAAVGQPKSAKPLLTQQVSSEGRVPTAAKLPAPFGMPPAAILLGAMLAGTVLVLVSGTGRETLNSIDFERTYREEHKSASPPAAN